MSPHDAAADEAKCEDLEKVVVNDTSEKFFQVRAQLPPQEKEELVEFLKLNIDVFAWDACDAPGIDPAFICHHLNVNPSITPKKQPPQRLSREHTDAIRDKVIKLKRAGAIIPQMVGQHYGSQEEKWKVASLCRLHGPKQSMPKGPVPHASDRPAGGRNSGPSSDEFSRCLSGLSSNTADPGGSGEDNLYDAY